MDTIFINNQVKIPEIESVTFINDTLFQRLNHLLIANKDAIDNIAKTINETSKHDRFLTWLSNDTLFSVFITLIVFALGIMITRLYKFLEKRSNRTRLKKYFKYHLDEIIIYYSSSLQRAYRDFYQTRGMQTGIPLSEPKVFSNDFERISKIDTKELFESISDSDSFSNILSELDFIHKITTEVKIYHTEAHNYSKKLTEELSELSDTYMYRLANYVEFERVNN